MDNSTRNTIGDNIINNIIEREPNGRFKKGYVPYQFLFKKGNPGRPKGAFSKTKQVEIKSIEDNKKKIIQQKETIYRLKTKISSLSIKLKAEKSNTAKKAMYDKVNLVKKSSKYYLSVAGFPIFRSWYIKNKLTPGLATVLIIMSYHKFILLQDFKLWDIKRYNKILTKLIDMGLCQKIESPSKNGASRKRHAYILTPTGTELVKSYENYYDSSIDKLIGNKNPEKFNLSKVRIGNKKIKNYTSKISPIL